MALSNTAAGTVPSESVEPVERGVGSPVGSAVGVTSSNSVATQDMRLGPSTHRTPLNLELPQLSQTPVHEGAKEATTHDFLSLYKSAVPVGKIETAAAQGSIPSVATQDFLQPLEHCSKLVSGNIIPPGLVTTSLMNHLRASSTNSYGVEEATYRHPNGNMELSSTVFTPMDGMEGGLIDVKDHISKKMEVKNNDCKANTPRSKHSATEQRRRSKINDRFQMLRQLVPNNDQKRDKASFLLEVIEYIQVLQEKVQKYESTDHGRQQERLKAISWDVPQRNSGARDSITSSSFMDPFYAKEHIPKVPFDMKQAPDSSVPRGPSLTSLSAPIEHEVSSSGHGSLPVDRTSQGGHLILEKIAITRPVPVSSSTQLPVQTACGKGLNHANHSVPSLASESRVSSCPLPYDNQAIPLSHNNIEAALPVSHGNSQLCGQPKHSMEEPRQQEFKGKDHRLATNNETCKQDLTKLDAEVVPSGSGSSFGLLQNGDVAVPEQSGGVINGSTLRSESQQTVGSFPDTREPVIVQGGVINVSTVYSQKLLDTLTRALETSGVDLSQANISVQINLGKAAVATSSTKGGNESTEIQQLAQAQELEHLKKRPKVE